VLVNIECLVYRTAMIRYKIGKYAKSKGYTARRLAKEAGIGHNTAALIMRAKTSKEYSVGADVLDKVCAVLKCQPGDILKYQK
jgi:DNA-binding Xre family transcriptional regulator